MFVARFSEVVEEGGWAGDVTAREGERALASVSKVDSRLRTHPSPCTGSMIIAATSFGATCCRSRRSSWCFASLTISSSDVWAVTPRLCQYGYAVHHTPGCTRKVKFRRARCVQLTMKGPVLCVYIVLLRVSAPLPYVLPWYAPWKQMMLSRPVALRATFTAASTASEPIPSQL